MGSKKRREVSSDRPGPPPPRSGDSWLHRQRDDLARDALVAAVVGALLLCAGFYWDDRMADRDQANAEALALNAEMLENVRFVRTLSRDLDSPRAFIGLYLEESNLGGIDLSCDVDTVQQPRSPCVQLNEARLRGADLAFADLTGASLTGADLRDAVVAGATLDHTVLWGAKLAGAQFEGAELSNIDLRGVDFSGANVEGVAVRAACHDATTVWHGTDLPPSDDRACLLRVVSGIDLSD